MCGFLRTVSEPVVIVTTLEAPDASASVPVTRGRSFLRSVAVPSVTSEEAEGPTVERGRGSGRC